MKTPEQNVNTLQDPNAPATSRRWERGTTVGIAVLIGGILLAGCDNGKPQTPEVPATGPACNLYVQVDRSGSTAHPGHHVPVIVTGNPGRGGHVMGYEVAYDAHDPIKIGHERHDPSKGETHHNFNQHETWVQADMLYKDAGHKEHTLSCGDGQGVSVAFP